MEIYDLKYELHEFIGYPILVVNKYLKKMGWEMEDSFHDYKWAWKNKNLKKIIVVKVNFVDDGYLGNEIVNTIYWYDGIYS